MNDNQQLLDVLTREGVLVAVNVRYWRARKKLDAQDVGLDPDDVTERLIRSLYQPVYLGERDEIDADDCTLERQRLKRKPAA